MKSIMHVQNKVVTARSRIKIFKNSRTDRRRGKERSMVRSIELLREEASGWTGRPNSV